MHIIRYVLKFSVLPLQTNGIMAQITEQGWDDEREDYTCRDWKLIMVPHVTAKVRNLDKTKNIPRNMICYVVGEKKTKTTVSGIEFSRDMKKVFGGSDGIRTVVFPATVRTVRQSSFCNVKSLQSAVMNEGLEVLGTNEYQPDGKTYSGVF